MSSFLEQYEALDVIGNGSFGIIRKVKRKSDGQIFARKELNFERMSEHDRKQIVAEVNILKDLHHDHIVRYHDRYVDRDVGILYILMEYCGGGDLSSVIKQAQRNYQPLSEDAIWNYFMQILLALYHCHHPNAQWKSGSAAGGQASDGKEKRAQILHRDLKPDNVFLDQSNTVKLGDFGLSKALAQTCFANTYVGTPYYMSPELMQERAYDSKSDIWALGCLIYELCALKPPFHEAKTHAELSAFIRTGRVPPLPRGYSQSLSSVIKAMLNLNPAMRPSAAQLLQHERLELVFKVSETEKMLSTVKVHKATVVAKERELLTREAALKEKETQMNSLLGQKDAEIASLQAFVSQLQQQVQTHSQQDKAAVEQRIRDAIAKREDELRAAVTKREEEVAAAITRREEEIMSAVRTREEDVCQAWKLREEQIRNEMANVVEERVAWVESKTEELRQQEETLTELKMELDAKVKAIEEPAGKRKNKPLEEVHNLLARMPEVAHPREMQPPPTPKPFATIPSVPETPLNRNTARLSSEPMPSAMKGIILTSTGEPLATPAPTELSTIFVKSPRVGLNFARIFDFGEEDDTLHPTSPTDRQFPNALASTIGESTQQGALVPQCRSRRSSVLPQRPPLSRALTAPSLPAMTMSAPSTEPTVPISSSLSSRGTTQLHSSADAHAKPVPPPPPANSRPVPEYDLADQENLPSPFIKKIDKGGNTLSGADVAKRPTKRQSGGTSLRAMATVNAANLNATRRKRASGPGLMGQASSTTGTGGSARPLLVSARKASEEARKALSRS